MFESHFGLRENPFASGHQSRFVYPSREHQEALAHLRYGIENHEPFVLITGEVGTGKTTALFEALGELQARVSVALITNSALTRGELLEEICLRFGVVVTAPATKPQAMGQLERHLLALRGRGERAILLLDEAQNFDRDLLEEIRLLSNLEAGGEKLLQIFLVGQPELESKLSQPELRQLRQRIGVHYRLRPLNLEETERYIQHRVNVAGGDAPRVFPWEACAEVHAVTNGIPREINQICAQALLDAYVDGAASVEARHVRSAATETTFQSVLPASESDPRLPPLPAWPAAVPAPPLPSAASTGPPPPTPTPTVAGAAPAGPPAAVPTVASAGPLPTAAESSRWEAWVASLAKPGETPEEMPAPPRAAAPAPQAPVPPTPAPPRAVMPAPVPAPPAPPPPLRPEEVQRIELPQERVAERAPSVERTRTPEPAAPGTRYAAERALEPPSGASPRGEDWRPPLWTPESSSASGKRGRTPPSRLDDRMIEEEPGRGGGHGIRWLIGFAVLAVVAIGAVLMFRFGPWAKHQKPVPPPQTPFASDTLPTMPGDTSATAHAVAPAPADTTVTIAPAAAAPDTAAGKPRPMATVPTATQPPPAAVTRPPVPKPSPTGPARPVVALPLVGGAARPAVGAPATHPVTNAPMTTPAPKSVAPSPAGPAAPPIAKPAATAAVKPMATPVQEFSISVGTYLDRARAQSELARIGGASGLTGRIAEVKHEGTTMFAVIIGAFPDRPTAEHRASDMVARGTVDEARILSRTVTPRP